MRREILFHHIFTDHHGFRVFPDIESSANCCTRINGQHSIMMDMGPILDMLPHYVGLKCEISLDNMVRELILNNSLDYLCDMGYSYLDDGDDSYNIIIAEMLKLNCSCLLCDEDYDTFPSLEVYNAHMRFAHDQLRHACMTFTG